MAEEAARTLTTHDEVDVDDMIAEQIRQMEKEVKSEYGINTMQLVGGGGTAQRDERTSMAMGHGSLDLSKSYDGFEKKATLRDSLRSSLGLSMGGERLTEPRMDGTGLKGLLMSDYRLDASLDNIGDGFNGGRSFSPARGSMEGRKSTVEGVSDDMENLLKILNNDENFVSGGKNELHIGSIGQVADMLQTEMVGFIKVVEEREQLKEGGGPGRDENRDEELREEGRAQARAKNLFGDSHVSASDFTRAASAAPPSSVLPIDSTVAVDAQLPGPRSRADELADLDVYLGVESSGASANAGAMKASPGKDGSGLLPPRYPMTVPPVTTPVSFAAAVGVQPGGVEVGNVVTSLDRAGLERALAAGWHPVQAAVDKEMAAADEILFRMRSLRTGLGSRLKHLDALHASVVTAPADVANAAAEIEAPPPMLRSSSEHWNGISRISETGVTHHAAPPHFPLMSASAAPKPQSAPASPAAPTCAAPKNVAPWMGKEAPSPPSSSFGGLAGKSLTSVGQEIQATLGGTMNKMMAKLADPPVGAKATQPPAAASANSNPVVPTPAYIIPDDIGVECPSACSQFHFHGSCMHSEALSKAVRKELMKALEKSQFAPIPVPAPAPIPVAVEQPEAHDSVLNGFGPTLKDLNEDLPPMSLLAQIDDLGSALGSSVSVDRNKPTAVQAVAGTGFDQFISSDLRSNPFSGEASSIPSSSSSIIGDKRKTLSPMPFRSREISASPQLYSVRADRFETVSVVTGEASKKRIIAPSDEELWLRERSELGASSVDAATVPTMKNIAPVPFTKTSYISKFPGAPSVSPDQLPWASEGGASSSLRLRPTEGMAIFTQREEAAAKRQEDLKREQDIKIAQVASGERSQRAPRVEPRTADMLTSGAGFREREEHLMALRAIRQNMSPIVS
jgi:hypothetical protein